MMKFLAATLNNMVDLLAKRNRIKHFGLCYNDTNCKKLAHHTNQIESKLPNHTISHALMVQWISCLLTLLIAESTESVLH